MKTYQIYESAYDKLVGILTKRLMNVVKDSFKRYKKRHKISDEIWPDFIWPKELKFSQYNLEEIPFKDSTINIEFYIKRDFVDNPDGIAFDGGAYIDEGAIEIIITLDPRKEPSNYTALVGHLKDTVRHEIDHLTQKGKSQKQKAIDFALRYKTQQEGNRWKYFILPEEISPMVRGLHVKAKNNRTSFEYEARKYLDTQMSYGEIEDQEKYDKILNTWMQFYNKTYNKNIVRESLLD